MINTGHKSHPIDVRSLHPCWLSGFLLFMWTLITSVIFWTWTIKRLNIPRVSVFYLDTLTLSSAVRISGHIKLAVNSFSYRGFPTHSQERCGVGSIWPITAMHKISWFYKENYMIAKIWRSQTQHSSVSGRALYFSINSYYSRVTIIRNFVPAVKIAALSSKHEKIWWIIIYCLIKQMFHPLSCSLGLKCTFDIRTARIQIDGIMCSCFMNNNIVVKLFAANRKK